LILLRVEEVGHGSRGLRFICGAIFGGVGHVFFIFSGSRGKRLLTFFDEESIDRCGVALGHGNGVCPRFEVDLQVN
jgi:hypothetical protein